VVLDGFFVHRGRTIEGKDGSALDELRIICTSLLMDTGKTELGFLALFKVFFAGIEAKSV
jgi:hypothetical protein